MSLPTQMLWFPAPSEDVTFFRRGCASLSLRPKTLRSLHTVCGPFPAPEGTGSVPHGRTGFAQHRRDGSRLCPKTLPFPAAIALSSPGIRRCWVPSTLCTITSGRPRTPIGSCAICTVFHRCPKAAVSSRTACWVPPALALWFSTVPEGAVVRRRSCVSFPLHPKMRGSLDAVRFPHPLSEDAGQILRDARSFTSARRRWLQSARRAGFDLYRVLWFLSASEDTAVCRSVCVPVVLHPKTLDLIDALYFPFPPPEGDGSVPYGARFSVYIRRYMPIDALPACDLGRSPERCPGTEVPGPDPIIPRSRPRPVPSPFPRFSGRGRLTGFLTVGWMPWTYPSEDG
jgi:hypothetical protein